MIALTAHLTNKRGKSLAVSRLAGPFHALYLLCCCTTYLPWQLREKHQAVLWCRSCTAIELVSKASPSRFWLNLPFQLSLFLQKATPISAKFPTNNSKEIANGASLNGSVFICFIKLEKLHQNKFNYILTFIHDM